SASDALTFRVYGFNGIGSAEAGGGIANFPAGSYSFGGTNFAINGAGANVTITGTVFEPEELLITDVVVSGIGENQATFSSTIPADGGDPVTARGFVYSVTSLNSNPEIGGSNVTQIPSGNGTGSFSTSLSNLNSVTQYSVKAYVTTASETKYTQVSTFVTPGPELLRYDIASLSGYNGSPINASFTAPNISSEPLTVDFTDLQVDSDFWEPVDEAIFLVGWQETLNMSKNYVEFTIEANTGYELNLATISIGVGRESTTNLRGPQIFRLYSDIG
ncbi:MAG: hypothetical protein LAT57_08600, partial [Balneolales bacterium]|nr:hypothetical protein [Balneolales bacterium]